MSRSVKVGPVVKLLPLLVACALALRCGSSADGPGDDAGDAKTYAWVPGDYGACSNTCGPGTRTRELVCRNQAGVAVADISRCGAQPQAEAEVCSGTAGCVWQSTVTRACDAPNDCSSGTVGQTSTCVDGDGNGVDATWCVTARPPDETTCTRTTACVLEVEVVSACSASGCGEGTIERSVTCLDESRAAVPLAWCPGPIPAATIPCADYSACVLDTSDWSACSTTCGVGTHTRSVTCRAPGGAPVSMSWCTDDLYPTSEACTGTASCCDGTTTAAAPFAGGTGTTASPYIICSAAQLDSVRTARNAAFLLAADLDLASSALAPIGANGSPFNGTFDGGDHTLANLTISATTSDYVGLFGFLQGQVQRVHLTDVQVEGRNYVGALVGHISSGAVVREATVSGSVTGTLGIGGVAGTMSGLCERVQADVVVNGTDVVGTIVGQVARGAFLARSTSQGSAVGRDYVGGAVGGVEGSLWRVGTTATASGRNQVGGLSGSSDAYVIAESWASGSATGTSYVGGLVGLGRGVLVESMSTASATGTDRVGGLVGSLDGFAGHVFSTGAVSGSSNVGGLVGSLTGRSSVAHAFWDTQSSGRASSADGTAVGKTSAQMRAPATYAGWQTYTVWTLADGGLPALRSDVAPCTRGPTGFSGGFGTPGDPYVIDAPEQLYAMSCNERAHYVLAADLDFTGIVSTPQVSRSASFKWLGVSGPAPIASPGFSGTLDGRGHHIIGWTGYDVLGGFFGEVASAAVTDLYFDAIDVAGGHASGGLAPNATAVSVSRVGIDGVVRGSYVVGGLFGQTNGGSGLTFTRCAVSAQVVAYQGFCYPGGLIGFLGYGQVTDSFATGDIIASRGGGFFGGGGTNASVDRCYATGSIAGSPVDGFGPSGPVVTRSYWDTQTSGLATSATGTGKTTAAMQTQSTFVDWDFNTVWSIDPGSYPTLR